LKIAAVNVEIAKELGLTPSQLAVRWTMQRNQVVIPIVGARKAEQIKDSLGASEIVIPDEQLKKLDDASKIELGFPHEFFTAGYIKDLIYGGKYDDLENHRR
jgi:aryl-alcohol dehydrogenase-like predicted oxidoreductase